MSAPRKDAGPARRWNATERLPARRRLLTASVGLAALLVVGRGVQLQGMEGERWAAVAAAQQQEKTPVPARRGGIYDRDGVPLALTRETFRLSVAPRELRDRDGAAAALQETLGLSRAAARRATDPSRRWVVVPGSFGAEEHQRLESIRGLHFERRLDRFYPQGETMREVLGGMSADARALGGIEQEMDSLLRGRDGFSVLRRDARGRTGPAGSLPVVPPTDGADVRLTLDLDLQEIAAAALGEAIRTTKSVGGDILLVEPRTGEVLAAVSRRPGGIGLGAFVEPYEPGSTLKPVFVAGLLAGRHASLSDRVYAEGGTWKGPNGRVIRDVHAYEWLTLRDALRVSSNIGMAKMVPRTPPAAQYRVLRDFGFGTPTGVEYPGEAGGRLPGLKRWSDFTPASLSMGYEVSVTPLQLTMAYAALANGGLLMEPRLVRSVTAADGETVREPAPRPVRRVIPREVSEELRQVLVSVVEDGTATRASLSTFEVAGKTGTARRTGAGGRYVAGEYNSTFVGFFPARDPQLAIYVKLDRPRGEYYGGVTAAPVTRETLQAILAARSPALDGRGLLATRLPTPASASGPASTAAVEAARPASGSEGTYVFLPDTPARREPAPAAPSAAVPDVSGLAMRDAVRRLHALGFRVRVRGGGAVESTSPAAGAALRRGAIVSVAGRER